jgi:2-polyprenyl-3-methyl-5-hydroxy-6-metoxy-1,4-benzoquinol methylase
MPLSSFAILNIIACELNSRKPESVLDCGIGSGLYGAMVRQYVDLGGDPKCKITGVEPFYEYKNPNWGHYDFVYINTMQGWLALEQQDSFDMILFLDVIEHMQKAEGYEILQRLKDRLNPGGWLLVSTPGEWVPQGAEHGNELEIHLSFWEPRDFAGFTILKDGHRKDEFQQRMTVVKYVK